MKIAFTPSQEQFRNEAAGWLHEQLTGAFADLHGMSSHTQAVSRRRLWEAQLAKARLSSVGWPVEWGGRGATLGEQVIFAEEYARARGPARLNHLGVELVAPTLLAYGTEEQKRRFLGPILQGEEIWCQGYSEPNAGSDLANVTTRAHLVTGPDGVFVLCRTDPGSHGNRGLSYLLVPMRQPAVTVRPIREMTGDAEFNETFLDGARTAAANIVGAPGEGWKVAMATLAFERGISTLAQQMDFRNEFEMLLGAARANGAASDPLIRQRIAQAHIGLTAMRYSALRMLTNAQSGTLSHEAFTYRLHWGVWHKKLGELAMDVLGPAGEYADPNGGPAHALQRLFLFSRSDTIYGGTSQIQRNQIAERALGLPKEPRGP
ncbi:MAG: acyl-CoA dehydrogenase family protein [Proteobacteria bacterium]|nr:acyl-CoA dehydrogenase family protein [Pseudomonadota bacterium]